MAGKCRDECDTVDNREYCETICDTAKPGNYYVQVYLGVVVPSVAPSGIHSFNLCQDGDCVNGGSTSTFGAFNEVEHRRTILYRADRGLHHIVRGQRGAIRCANVVDL